MLLKVYPGCNCCNLGLFLIQHSFLIDIQCGYAARPRKNTFCFPEVTEYKLKVLVKNVVDIFTK